MELELGIESDELRRFAVLGDRQQERVQSLAGNMAR
jgi:hypothetical protein